MRKPLFLFAIFVAVWSSSSVSLAQNQARATTDFFGIPQIAASHPDTPSHQDASSNQDASRDQDASSGQDASAAGGAPKQDDHSGKTAPTQPGKTADSSAAPAKLSVGGKFRYFAGQSFSPASLVLAGAYSGLTMAYPPKAYPREWRQGVAAFGRNYGDFMASWTALQGGKFVVASVLREDPRYFPSQHKNWFGRGFHAIRFAVIDQSDSGRPRLAVANFAGALAGGFVGNAYLPDAYSNSSHAWSRSAVAMGGFAVTNLAGEFHPELVKVARKLHLPFVKK